MATAVLHVLCEEVNLSPFGVSFIGGFTVLAFIIDIEGLVIQLAFKQGTIMLYCGEPVRSWLEKSSGNLLI